jgi:hypothetical protein
VEAKMGMSDTVIMLDAHSRLCCSEGHALRSFRTKGLLRPGLCTYLVQGAKIYLARSGTSNAPGDHEAEARGWRVDPPLAIHEQAYQLREVEPPPSLRIYGSCSRCAPVLVRNETPAAWGDIVTEHAVFVDFNLTFRVGEPLQIQLVSGTREALQRELRAGGAYVLEDDDPLAVAHRTLRLARERMPQAIAEWDF